MVNLTVLSEFKFSSSSLFSTIWEYFASANFNSSINSEHFV